MSMLLDQPASQKTVQTAVLEVFCLPHAPKNDDGTEALPFYATSGSAGMDVRAALKEAVTLAPLERRLIPTGLILHIPTGFEVQVRPRSGLSIKRGLTLVNCVGTIDSDYRDELMVPLINLSQEPQTVAPGERVAQLVMSPVVQAQVQQAFSTQRIEGRQGGFGSTGTA